MEIKHTPGPWRVGSHVPGAIFPERAPHICKMNDLGYPESEWKANGILISAAPCMLEALKNIENDDGKTMPPSAWKLIQDAIAKAEGMS